MELGERRRDCRSEQFEEMHLVDLVAHERVHPGERGGQTGNRRLCDTCKLRNFQIEKNYITTVLVVSPLFVNGSQRPQHPLANEFLNQ